MTIEFTEPALGFTLTSKHATVVVTDMSDAYYVTAAREGAPQRMYSAVIPKHQCAWKVCRCYVSVVSRKPIAAFAEAVLKSYSPRPKRRVG